MTRKKLSDFVVPAMRRRRDSNMDRQDIQDGKRWRGFNSTYPVILHIHVRNSDFGAGYAGLGVRIQNPEF